MPEVGGPTLRGATTAGGASRATDAVDAFGSDAVQTSGGTTADRDARQVRDGFRQIQDGDGKQGRNGDDGLWKSVGGAAAGAGIGGRRRVRAVFGAAVAAAVLVNAGVAWVYWSTVSGGRAGVELRLRARSDYNRPLVAGEPGNLTVTLTNDHDFPIVIDRVTPAGEPAVADDLHREAGCVDVAVEMTRAGYDVRWSVPRNTVGAFTIPQALLMVGTAQPACAGAVFSLPIEASGTRED